MPDSSSPNKAESQMTLASARSTPEESHRWYKKKRSTSEKILILTIFFAIFVVISLSVSLAAVISGYQLAQQLLENSTYKSQTGIENICFSKECIKAASDILDRIDTGVNPCDNFYKFACGSYERNAIIPDEKTAVTQFSTIQDALQDKLRQVIDQPIFSNDSSTTILVKNLYTSCMNMARIEEQGIEPLRKQLDQMGGWPVVVGDLWDPSTFSWTEAIYRNRERGYSVDYLIDFSVTINIKNSSWRIIDLDQPPLGMPSRKYLLKGFNDSDVKAYLQYQVSLAVMLGADRERAERELKQSLYFEMQIANYSLSSEDRRDMSKLYNKMTIKDLINLAPSIPWLEYINRLLPDDIKVTENEPVIVNVPEYIINIEKLLARTDKRVVANYLLWRVASASVGFLSNEVRDIELKYSKQLTGKGTRAPRWKECMAAVSGSLSHAVGALYAKTFFQKNAKKQADEMVAYIKEEFTNILRTVDWMDSDTLYKALRKAEAIRAYIGYPEEILVDHNLEELYKNLYISEGDLLENMRNLTIFGTNYSYSELRKKVDKYHWKNHGSAAVVNAFYSPLENSIQFPAGILQGVFYEAERPKYLNFGGIGFVIGHEITHGFDDKGRQFDENGNLENWWDEGTQQKFIEKSKCIIWQYGNYTEPQVNLNINGVNTQGENIADNGGIKEAYRAYRQWVEDNGEEKTLPGLTYTQNQLFWISSAHVWCSKYRPETMKLRIITGSHSPVMFRVNGPLSNIEEFSRDWQCKPGANMNPYHKCTVW